MNYVGFSFFLQELLLTDVFVNESCKYSCNVAAGYCQLLPTNCRHCGISMVEGDKGLEIDIIV